jgi:hypothetical protein
MSDRKELKRQSQIAWGIAVICGFFLLETWNVDQQMPNPATPFIWALLGAIAAGAVAMALWFGHRSRQAPEED